MPNRETEEIWGGEIKVGGEKYRLHALEGPDLAALVPLFRRTFRRRDFTADWLTRKYAGEFRGVRGFSFVASTEGGEAVAACGMLPWPIRFEGRTEVAAQVVDAATHPRHRRRGLFGRLAALAQARCEAGGVSFFFAFPHRNGDSYPGFTGSFGYEDIGTHIEFRRAVRTLWAERIARRGGPLRLLFSRRLDRVFDGLAPHDVILPNSLAREGFASTHRDAAFHRYKGFAGSRVLQLPGGRIWLKVRHGIQVGDIEARSEEDLERSLAALERVARGLGIHRIVLHSSPGTRLTHFLSGRFEAVPSVAVVYRDVCSRIPPEKLRFSLGDLDNF